MPSSMQWKSTFSKLFVTSLIVGLGACSSKKAANNNDVDFGNAALNESSESNVVNASDLSQAKAERKFRSSGAYEGAKRVRVETSPIDSDGFALNGIYFVRGTEESWSSISQTLYGRPDRDALLQKWNKGKALGVGSAIYYNSPSRPNDKESMKPFAMDFGSALERHVVQPGESLSQIAQNTYGNPMSWKEISALNPSIKNPDRIEVGQEIYLQPKNVDTQGFLNNLIAQNNQSSPSGQDQSGGISGDQQDMSNATHSEEPPSVTAPPVEPKPEIVAKQNLRRQETGVSGWMKFIKGGGDSSNFFAIGLVLVLGALIFLVINKRRKAAAMHRDEITNVADFQQKTGSQD